MANITSLGIDSGPGKHISVSKSELAHWKHFLSGTRISLSISESDDLPELGFDVIHLKDVIIELSRYIVASGGSLAFGGDMRQGGFTELLFDILAYYKTGKEIQPNELLLNFLAYPLSTTLTNDKIAELKHVVTFVKIPPPDDMVDRAESLLSSEGIDNRYLWSRCLTAMREELERNADAKVILGGRFYGFKGKYPGILEEFEIAVKSKKPIYLIAAFGGVTAEIFRALQGDKTELFEEGFYDTDDDYKKLVAQYLEKGKEGRIDYPALLSMIKSCGIEGVSQLNGLSVEDNLRLGKTSNLAEIVYLVLKGLTTLSYKTR